MNVDEYATAAAITPRRVRALITRGALPATKVGRGWVIDGPVQRPSGRRPLSPTSQDALTNALHRRGLRGLTGQLRARTATRIRELRASTDPSTLLVDWWGGKAPAQVNGRTNLVMHAFRQNNEFITKRVNHRPSEYLRDPADLADVVSTERSIRGLSRKELADLARVDSSFVFALEQGREITSLGDLRRVLRAIDVEPSALPSIDMP
ncbi:MULTISPECIES: helix-turn-helix domain-containing protein [Subtercola]|uniref:XRE family transcriptional regulator n=1 Tax=Subtercola vilae TaxID=2056433 RepID=A0A4T2C5X8_9MICO|nr:MULTISPECIES: helix-turn-helix transcriptional regulator [Subtercola]MEA9984111.1 helix-turn-helix transcriptional regulator [Subtercola sp. RTI3]TIH38671.1 XRE family transcriptional regulator [Subtercola vilae]